MKPLHYYWYRLKWNIAENTNWIPKTPLHVDLELTNQCNLKCTMCRHGIDPEKTQGQMTYNNAVRIIDNASALKIYSMKFQFRGESALHKDLEKIIAYAKQKGIKETQLNTNLVAFNNKRLQKLCDSGLDRLIISIDGATRETYESIRKGAKWDRLIFLLNMLQGIKNKPIIRIQATYQDENKKDMLWFRTMFEMYCDELNIKQVRHSNAGKKRKSCPQPRQRLIIGWDMKTYGCCNSWYSESLIGSFGGIITMWNSFRMNNLRHVAEKPATGKPCKTCLVRSSYK